MSLVKYMINSSPKHWVGNGFHVYGVLRSTNQVSYRDTSPFILCDYAPAKYFDPQGPMDHRRGVGMHPHRGFETVTMALQGEIEHRDSSGGHDVIEQGDVQWMRAGSGVLHDEFHSTRFSRQGGVLEMIQLWVNLPSKDKMLPANYQAIKSDQIVRLKNDDHQGEISLIAGKYIDEKDQEYFGPAQTHSPMNIIFFEVKESANFSVNIEPDYNTLLLLFRGDVQFENEDIYQVDEMSAPITIVLNPKDRARLHFKARHMKALFLHARPIDEPIVAYGPFVMNTEEEIIQALKDFS